MITTPSERGHRRPASTSTWPPTTRHGWCWGSCWQCEKGMPVPRTHCQGPRVGCDSDDNPPSRALNFARNGSLTCRFCATSRRSMVRNAIALVAHILKNYPNCDPFACRQAPSFSANAAVSLAFSSSAANLIARFNLLRRSDACRNKDDWAFGTGTTRSTSERTIYRPAIYRHRRWLQRMAASIAGKLLNALFYVSSCEETARFLLPVHLAQHLAPPASHSLEFLNPS